MKEKILLFIAYNIKFLKDEFYDISFFIIFFLSHVIAYLYYYNLYN